jgi:hypothetical protein
MQNSLKNMTKIECSTISEKIEVHKIQQIFSTKYVKIN